jgi:hypothetical protein
MSDVKQAIDYLLSASAPPQPPTNLSVTPIAGANVIQFSRSNATNFRVYASPTLDRSKATVTDLGTNNSFTHALGAGGVDQYYWLEAISSSSSTPSSLVGPVKGTTLALGASATVTPPLSPSYATVYDTTLGIRRPVVYPDDRVTPGKQAE